MRRWVVGVIFNNNGMATWCWEAAHALAAAGDDVTLLALDGVVLPGEPHAAITLHRVSPARRRRGFIDKVIGEFARLSTRPDPVMRPFVTAGQAATANPVLLLNHSGLVDPALPARQFVAAWARETRLRDYLSRIPLHVRTGSPLAFVRVVLDAVGWWRRDWHGYRHATKVLATTERFRAELTGAGVPAVTVHPCLGVCTSPPLLPPRPPVRLLSAALNLGEPRKRVAWMLDALRDFQARGRDVRLTLVGAPTPDIERRAERAGIDVTFTGPLRRDAFLAQVDAHHALIFASTLDDWGYVVAEAMSRGRAVVVPDEPPFDEMGAHGAVRFADHPEAFVAAIDEVIDHVETLGRAAHRQASRAFSHETFAAAVQEMADDPF